MRLETPSGAGSGNRASPSVEPSGQTLTVHALGGSPALSNGRSPHAETFARLLLERWGVVFRDLIARESLAPAWRDLLVALRRMEARGEVRGGRFVSGFVGEQFARPEAIDLLRAVRRNGADAVSRVPMKVNRSSSIRQTLAIGSDPT